MRRKSWEVNGLLAPPRPALHTGERGEGRGERAFPSFRPSVLPPYVRSTALPSTGAQQQIRLEP